MGIDVTMTCMVVVASRIRVLRTKYVRNGVTRKVQRYRDRNTTRGVSEVSVELGIGAPVGAPVYVGPRVHMYIER